MGINLPLLTAFTLPEKAFHQIWERGCRDLLPLSHEGRVKSGHGLGDKAWFTVGVPVHPKGVRWRALCRPVTFFFFFLYGPGFVHGALSCWNRTGSSCSCCHRPGNTLLSTAAMPQPKKCLLVTPPHWLHVSREGWFILRVKKLSTIDHNNNERKVWKIKHNLVQWKKVFLFSYTVTPPITP